MAAGAVSDHPGASHPDAQMLTQWRQIIKRVLGELAAIPFPEVVHLESKAVFDESRDNYLVLVQGWEGDRRMHGCLVHLEIKDGKIWIQRDGTEDGVAVDLVAAGVPKDRIVLGFRSPARRARSGFAVQ